MADFSLKSIDPVSTTIMGTTISTVLIVILSIILLIFMGVTAGASAAGGFALVVVAAIFGTIILSVFHFFTKSVLYNFLSKKLGSIDIDLFENKEIKKFSVKSTSLVLTFTDTIMFIIYILVGALLLQLLFNIIYSLVIMLTGNMILAYLLYQVIMLLNDPLFIAAFIVGFAVVSIIRYLIAIYAYNNITGKVYGILLRLRKEDNYTVIDSVNPINTALIMGIIGLIFGIISGVVNLIASVNIVNFVIYIISGFVGTFICVLVLCLLYNFLSSKIGKVKVVLDEA